jgi:hypothetical protein
MADIAAGDVTYTILNTRKINGSPSRKLNRMRLAFGNGTLTYPAGGIPLSIGKLGCPAVVESLVIVDKGTSGYEFMYDQSAKKLVVFQAPAQTHDHDMFILGGQTHDATLGLNSSSLGKNTATNITLNGANSATTGGVLSETLAAAALAQASAVAIAAQTIEVEVIGW